MRIKSIEEAKSLWEVRSYNETLRKRYLTIIYDVFEKGCPIWIFRSKREIIEYQDSDFSERERKDCLEHFEEKKLSYIIWYNPTPRPGYESKKEIYDRAYGASRNNYDDDDDSESCSNTIKTH